MVCELFFRTYIMSVYDRYRILNSSWDMNKFSSINKIHFNVHSEIIKTHRHRKLYIL